MTGILDKEQLIEIIIEKHNQFIETYNNEYTGLGKDLDTSKNQLDEVKKEMSKTEEKIMVLNEKYHLLFHQAKKQREEIFRSVLARMQKNDASGVPGIMRLENRLQEIEKKLQTSKNIEEEEKMIMEIKEILSDFGSSAGSGDFNVSCDIVKNKITEANSAHKELLGIAGIPDQQVTKIKEHDTDIKEKEGRYNWLEHRIESHNNALAYWEKQKGEIKVD